MLHPLTRTKDFNLPLFLSIDRVEREGGSIDIDRYTRRIDRYCLLLRHLSPLSKRHERGESVKKIESLETYLSELGETFDQILEEAKKLAEQQIKEMPKERPDIYG